MTGHMPNENARAHLLASLEYGVSPLLPRDLYTERDEEAIAEARALRKAEQYRERIAEVMARYDGPAKDELVAVRERARKVAGLS